jgi:hypothetical protein
VKGTCAAHGQGGDFNDRSGPMLSEDVCEHGALLHDELVSVIEVVVCTLFPCTNSDFAYGRVSASRVGVTYHARF